MPRFVLFSFFLSFVLSFNLSFILLFFFFCSFIFVSLFLSISLLPSSSYSSQVRVEAVKAVVSVVDADTAAMDDVMAMMQQRAHDNAPIVRKALFEGVGQWGLTFKDRYIVIILMLLTACTDTLIGIAFCCSYCAATVMKLKRSVCCPRGCLRMWVLFAFL
jgi:hypothetical protein